MPTKKTPKDLMGGDGGMSPTYQQQQNMPLPPGVIVADLYPNVRTLADIEPGSGRSGTGTPPQVTGTRRTPAQSLVVTFQHGDSVLVKEGARAADLRGQVGTVTDTKLQSRGYVRVVFTHANRVLNMSVKNLEPVTVNR